MVSLDSLVQLCFLALLKEGVISDESMDHHYRQYYYCDRPYFYDPWRAWYLSF